MASGCPLDPGQQSCMEDAQCADLYGFGAVCGASGYCEVEGDGKPVGDNPSNGEVGVLVDGISATTVRTLGVAAQTGTTRDLGIGMTVGIQAALSKTAEEGPLRLQHFARDDGYVPDDSALIMQEITADGDVRDDPEPAGGAESIEGRATFAVVGSMGSPTSLRMLDTINSSGILFFGTYSGASHLYKEIPDKVVWQYRPRYEDEAYELTRFLVDRAPRGISPRNVFAFSQSPVDGDLCDFCNESSGVSGRAAEATLPDQNVMDAYGFSGYRGIRRALEEAGIAPDQIPMGTYRANSTDVSAGVDYFIRWVVDEGLTQGAHSPVIPQSGPYEVGIVMIPVALPGAEFVKQMITEVDRFKSGEKPNAITTEEWDQIPAEKKERLQELMLSFTSISPAADVMATTLAADDADRFCGTFEIVVSQVVPFPNGGSAAATDYRADLAANFPNEAPGFVTFEGWAVGKIWAEVVRRTLEQEGELTIDTVIDTMQGFSNVDVGVGALIDWGPNDHQGSDQIFGTRINASCVYEEFELGS